MAKAVELEFQIRGIELIESHVKTIDAAIKNPIFAFTVNLEHSTSAKNSLIVVAVTINVMLDGNNNKIIGLVRLNIGFEVPKLRTFIRNEQFDLPKEFIEILNSISISTARGVAFSQFRGTSLHSAIFPIINPQTLHKKESTD